jgi:hypothetical protein
MAITESHPARPGGGDPPTAEPPGSRRRRRWRGPVPLGLGARMAGTCYDPNGWTGTDAFYVKERFGIFTHWVAVQFQPDLILHQPGGPGGPGTEPAKDLTCPAGGSQ